MRTLEQLVDAFVALDSKSLAAREGLLDVRSGIKSLQERLRGLSAEVEAALVDNIEAHGDIDIGEGKRLYVGWDRSYKCRSVERTFEAVFESVGGDQQRMCEHLSTNAWKPGACRKTLGDRFDDVFESVEAKDVRTGSAKRIVKTFDPQFGGGA
jgi:hypothetical protein